jgi:hypothetical protein
MITRVARKPLLPKVWRYLLNVGIFTLLLYLIFEQVLREEGRGSQWEAILQATSKPRILLILPVLLLLPLNWGLEVLKWQKLIHSVKVLRFNEATRHVLTGVAAGFITPNRIGEHVGRIYPLPTDKRAHGLSRNVQGSFAQVIVTLCLGFFSLISLELRNELSMSSTLFAVAIGGGFFALAVLSTLFFYWSKLPLYLPNWLKRWLYKFLPYKNNEDSLSKHQLILVLGLSFLRFAVYLSQFMLICMAMGMRFEPTLGLSITCIFFFQTLSPGLALADLGIRGNLALFFLSPFHPDPIIPLAAALLIWVINLVIPSIIGGMLIALTRPSSKTEYQGLAES